MSPVDSSSEKYNPTLEELSERQLKFAKRAAKAMAKAFNARREEFEVYKVDDGTEEEEKTTPHPKEGEPGYDGKPWVEARTSDVGRYAIKYTGEGILENFEPGVHQSIMVKNWAFPVETYPPQAINGVPSLTIPRDI